MERALSAIPTKRVLLNSSFCSVLFKDKAASNTLQRGSELQVQPCSPGMLSVSERHAERGILSTDAPLSGGAGKETLLDV